MDKNENPLRSPWRCGDGITIRDADNRIVAVVSRGNETLFDQRCAVIAAAPQMLGLLRQLIAIEGPQPGTAQWAGNVIHLLESLKGTP